ncbi:MAG TPA: hypothetical protein VME19_22030 [Streptosporangiaceae bacterium]|nr:hypothetical protein [Streptosporangiaceae bacterium]
MDRYDRPRSESGVEGGPTKGRLAAFAVGLAGSAVLGVVAGLIWAAVAPRALLQEVASGEAQVVNVETSAYIVADAWFCLIGAVGGLITGVLGYTILIRRAGWPATAGLVLGALAAALVALWVGSNIGLGTYNHLLASSQVGAYFNSSLALGAKSALVFWPLLTSVVVLMAETGSRGSNQPLAGVVGPQGAQPGWPADDGHAP